MHGRSTVQDDSQFGHLKDASNTQIELAGTNVLRSEKDILQNSVIKVSS